MMRWPSSGRKQTVDPKGRPLIGLTETGEALFGLGGHHLVLGGSGSGKTTSAVMPALFSEVASSSRRAILALDNKNELAIQIVPMLIQMGLKVAVIDDMNVCPELAEYRISLNLFGAAVATHRRDPRDTIFATEPLTAALIPDPTDGDEKNKYFREWPKKLITFGVECLLNRDADLTTPSAVCALLSDSDMLTSFADIEAEEGSGALCATTKSILEMCGHEHWPQHLDEAQRSLRLFAKGRRLHEVGSEATHSHFDLIQDKYVVFVIGPMAHMERLGSYYAMTMLGFFDAFYAGAGPLLVLADEFTNCPLKSTLCHGLTTIRCFGGAVQMFAQSRSEIERKFGRLETQTIEDNCVVRRWLSFSFEEAERVSKAMGEQHAVASSLGSDGDGMKTNINLSLIKQRHMSPADLMAMPKGQQLVHIKGLGFFLAPTVAQNQISPYCDLIAPNPMEGGRLPPDPKITLTTPEDHA
jgi:type IV secretion system protein VirD4